MDNSNDRQLFIRFILVLILMVALIVLAYVGRHLLFAHGVLQGDEVMRTTSLGLSALIVALSLPVLVWYRRAWPGRNADAEPSSGESSATVLAAVLGVAVASFTLTETLAPNTPEDALVAACRNAPVYGAEFTVMTGDQGVSFREGPGRQFEQAGRYGPECSVGVEGMCLGEAWPDLWLGTLDQRWFKVHNADVYLPAAAVVTQAAELKVASGPSEHCGERFGTVNPVLSALTLASAGAPGGDQVLRVDADDTVSVGYAYTAEEMSSPRSIGTPVEEEQGAQMDTEQGFAGVWPTARTREMLGADTDLTIVAVPCLAGNVPFGEAALFAEVTLTEAGASEPRETATVPDDAEALVNIACARNSGSVAATVAEPTPPPETGASPDVEPSAAPSEG
ncbi:hypothetical protein [Nocardiopsis flavescens]